MTLNRDTVGEIHNYGVDVKNREIYINEFDDSGESAGVDHRMLQSFIKNINILKNLSRDQSPYTCKQLVAAGTLVWVYMTLLKIASARLHLLDTVNYVLWERCLYSPQIEG